MYSIMVGLEIHIQQKTKTKMFCACSNAGESMPPNTTICSVCLGHPGVLPFVNEQAVEWGAKMALALNCTINEHSKFDRKNYFYPDLPKGYQISQFDQPVGVGGWVDVVIPAGEGVPRTEAHIRINRLHLEEDAAKLQHVEGGKASLVDYNRGGTPLMEIVTEPDFKTAQEAKIFLQDLRLLARTVGVSEADMEKGNLRCDANVSVHFDYQGMPVSTPISEIKNLNSFRSVEHAIEYEAERMYRDWLAGGDITKRKGKITVGWDDAKSVTIMQRGKEDAHDYRYFPEPDIPPLYFSAERIAEIKASLPELPVARRARLMNEYGVTAEEARILVEDGEMGVFFEQSTSELAEWLSTSGIKDEEQVAKSYRLLTSWLINKLPSLLAAQETTLAECKITPENFAEFVAIVFQGKINSSAGVTVLEEMLKTGAGPQTVITEKNLEQVNDEGALTAACEAVLAANPDAVANYKAGKINAVMFMVGQVMKETKGKASPEVVKDMLERMMS